MGIIGGIRREWTFLTGLSRMLRRVRPVARDPSRTWPDEVGRLARRFGPRTALVSDGESLTYEAFHRRGNRYARWALAAGVGKGDTVVLLMENRPEYLAAWLGITRAGGVVALVNTSLTGSSLSHAIDTAAASQVIVSAAMLETFQTARTLLAGSPRIWSYGEGPFERIDAALEAISDADLGAGETPEITTADRCLLIYTSGTTGLPKAASISHYRCHAMMRAFAAAAGAGPGDRMYVALPLYHTSGGLLAVGTVLTVGGTAVIAPRFSARRFWADVARHDCTLIQYIGEISRYLLNAPSDPAERAHRVRLACGNGMRPEVWEAFQQRFAIPRVFEWYAATEGNAVLFNLDGRPGAVGRIPFWARRRLPMRLVRMNEARDDVLRGGDGRCIRCAPGEAGELISEIRVDPDRPAQRFEGYTDPEAARAKILTDVFRPGDRWFRTGDLLVQDRLGYFRFVDRLGDTFRWKGENVSTTEVAAALCAFPGITGAAVYGVAVPGADGKAGMASLEAVDAFDLDALAAHLAGRLPAYARPLFLRITAEMATTGTFKIRTAEMARQGFDPAAVADPLFFLDGGRYRPLDPAFHAAIAAGTIRL